MGQRQEQVESALRKALGSLIAEGLSDPRVTGLVSVTQVKLADEGRTARVGVSVLPADNENRVLHGLRSAAGHLRSQLDRKVRMRTTPRLDFYLDQSLKREAEVLASIRDAVDDSSAEPQDQEQSSTARNNEGQGP